MSMSIIGRAVRSMPSWADDDDRWYANPFVVSGNPGLAGRTVTEETALTFSVVYACIKTLSDSVATLPLHMYMRLSDGGRIKATERQIYRILTRSINPEMSVFRWKSVVMAHLAAWGNHYSYVHRTDGGRVVSLWPLNPALVTVTRNAHTTEIEYEFRHPKIPRVFNRSQIFHIPGFGYNGLVGKSPIGLAKEAIGLGLAAEEFGARFYGDGTHPSVIIKHPNKLDPESHTNLKNSLLSAVGGLGKSHRMLLLEDNMTIDNISIAPEEAQFLSTRKFQIQEICRFYGMKPHMVADLDRATFSNIEHQGIEFVVHTLGPWLALIEAELAHYFLLPEERRDFYFEFMVEKFLRGDIKTRYEAYQIARNGGWINADEIREKENMRPMDNGMGKVYTIQAGVQSLEFLSDNPSGKLPEPVKEEPKPGEEPITTDEAKKLFKSLRIEVNGLLTNVSKEPELGKEPITAEEAKALFKSLGNEVNGLLTDVNKEHFTLFREMWEHLQGILGNKQSSETEIALMQGLKGDVQAIREEIKNNSFDDSKALERDNALSKKMDNGFKDMEAARVKREGKLFADFMALRKEEDTLVGKELILHVESVKESLLGKVAEMAAVQVRNEDAISTKITEIMAEISSVPAEVNASSESKIEYVMGVFIKEVKKNNGELQEELGNIVDQVNEIKIDKTTSDGENRLQLDSLKDGLLLRIEDISKRQAEGSVVISDMISKVEDANEKTLKGVVDEIKEYTKKSVSSVFTKELTKLEKHTDKILTDQAEEKRVREEQFEGVIRKLEGMVEKSRTEIKLLRDDQVESNTLHTDEIARLEEVISALESRYTNLLSGRTIANKDKVISQYIPLIQDAMQAVINRESIAVKRAVGKFSSNRGKLAEWLEDFYRNLPEFMHLKLDKVIRSFIEAVQVEVIIEREVPGGDAQGDLGVLIGNYIREFVSKHVELSLNRLKGIIGNEDPLAVEVVLDEWHENRAMQIAVDETNNMCELVDKFVGHEEEDDG